MSRSLKRLVSDEQNEVLDRLRRRIRRDGSSPGPRLPVGDDPASSPPLHDDFAAADAGSPVPAAESDDDVDLRRLGST